MREASVESSGRRRARLAQALAPRVAAAALVRDPGARNDAVIGALPYAPLSVAGGFEARIRREMPEQHAATPVPGLVRSTFTALIRYWRGCLAVRSLPLRTSLVARRLACRALEPPLSIERAWALMAWLEGTRAPELGSSALPKRPVPRCKRLRPEALRGDVAPWQVEPCGDARGAACSARPRRHAAPTVGG